MTTFTIFDSPIGGLVLVARGGGLTGVYHEYHSPEPSPVLLGAPFDPLAGEADNPRGSEAGSVDAARLESENAAEVFRVATEWLEGYFSGQIADRIPYVLNRGTDFQREVWAAVSEIPYGETRTYKDIAAAMGNQDMGRAIGAAVRANPLSIVIPGHRVVGSGGAITGYAAGVAVKRALLELETTVAMSAVA
ncbi:methylated-DNA-[protein]-cysteine S-methyltransferase [Arthrobacter pigmenti]|uniref:methylated-DNA--[protein]-cysteine S-methyltransferase n=1 Tax=Arthrobacter pigmenti TaxID=271432 RepID=A0A846RLM2_9MICC|nr:methylated-DNA--[protein]-cysteine S-methyltransferase [Arthrobacter pigmenti]NJC22540.1 methylated-DNA-[protein]-cysteine S-methyltransferase [Arthrobacter pigmenti]